MLRSSNGNISAFYWPFVRGIHRSPLNSPHKGQWRGAFMFSLICVWINGWVNNREAGDLRRHRADYGVIVMYNANNHDWHVAAIYESIHFHESCLSKSSHWIDMLNGSPTWPRGDSSPRGKTREYKPRSHNGNQTFMSGTAQFGRRMYNYNVGQTIKSLWLERISLRRYMCHSGT